MGIHKHVIIWKYEVFRYVFERFSMLYRSLPTQICLALSQSIEMTVIEIWAKACLGIQIL